MGVPGIEPGTSALSGLRSNQLSYTPEPVVVPLWFESYRPLPVILGLAESAILGGY